MCLKCRRTTYLGYFVALPSCERMSTYASARVFIALVE
jgi:hypothetical protein